jgi:23S rRNA pseudouridine1911/1915/1917 synthase
MVVHPGAGNYKATLVNALIYKYKNNLSDVSGTTRPGIVHRIDKETSGLLVVAKNNKAHSNLGKQFSNHTIQRTYQALAWGILRPLNGKIETLIGRSRKNRQLMSVTEITGKKSITNYKTLKVFNIKNIPKISFIECELETGRTHQIRVHMAYKGNSLLGDQQYGKKNLRFKKINEEFEDKLKILSRQALHAKSLGFIHPTNKKRISFESKLPKDFQKILNLLNKLNY